MFDPHRYTIKIRKVVEADREYFSASVDELPDVAAFEPTYAEAYEVVVDAVSQLAEIARSEDRDFPMPNAPIDEDYSGRVTLRLSPNLHRRLGTLANDEGQSLNTHIVNILSAHSVLDSIFAKADKFKDAVTTVMNRIAGDDDSITSIDTLLATSQIKRMYQLEGYSSKPESFRDLLHRNIRLSKSATNMMLSGTGYHEISPGHATILRQTRVSRKSRRKAFTQ